MQHRGHLRALGAGGPGERAGPRAGHQHALGDGHREAPVDGLDLRHVADAQARAAADRAGAGPQRADHRPQQRGLARARRPDDPLEIARSHRQVDDREGPERQPHSGSDALEADQVAHCGSPPRRRPCRTGRRRQGGRVAAEGLDHRQVVEAHQAGPGVLRVARRAGQVVVAQDVDVADAGLPPNLGQNGLGNTSDPKIAGTSSSRTCSIRRATSRGGRLAEVGDLDRADHPPP